jgi:hypothetical protein
MTDTARVKPGYQAGRVSVDTNDWVALQTALREARERAEAAEAGAAALREGLEWVLRAVGWRLWYYGSDPPPAVVKGCGVGADATIATDAGAATLAELQRLRAAGDVMHDWKRACVCTGDSACHHCVDIHMAAILAALEAQDA